MVTYGDWQQVSGRELVISQNKEAVTVAIDTGGVPFTVTAEAIHEENHTKIHPKRIAVNLAKPQPKGRVVFTITPVRPSRTIR